jgi:hypothetical protein
LDLRAERIAFGASETPANEFSKPCLIVAGQIWRQDGIRRQAEAGTVQLQLKEAIENDDTATMKLA